MRRFLLGWKQAGWDRKLKARIVNYADDFVILCRRKAEQAQEVMEVMMRKLKLRVNQQKTRICRVPEESFDFLGYTMGQCYRAQTGTAYIGTKPSKKGVARICEKISQMTQRKRCWKETEELVGELNLVVKDWGNYFRLGSVSKAYRVVDSHTRHRLRQWLCHKHKIGDRTAIASGMSTSTKSSVCSDWNASALTCRGRKLPKPCPKAGCGKTARPV
jgi:RNA-directed DNA polymerase